MFLVRSQTLLILLNLSYAGYAAQQSPPAQAHIESGALQVAGASSQAAAALSEAQGMMRREAAVSQNGKISTNPLEMRTIFGVERFHLNQREWMDWIGHHTHSYDSMVEKTCDPGEYVVKVTALCTHDSVERIFDAECSDGAILNISHGTWTGVPHTMIWMNGRSALDVAASQRIDQHTGKSSGYISVLDTCGKKQYGPQTKRECSSKSQKIGGFGVKYSHYGIESIRILCQTAKGLLQNVNAALNTSTIADTAAVKALTIAHHSYAETKQTEKDAGWVLQENKKISAESQHAAQKAQEAQKAVLAIHHAINHVTAEIRESTDYAKFAGGEAEQAKESVEQAEHLSSNIAHEVNESNTHSQMEADRANAALAWARTVALEDQKVSQAAVHDALDAEAKAGASQKESQDVLEEAGEIADTDRAIAKLTYDSEYQAQKAEQQVHQTMKSAHEARHGGQKAEGEIETYHKHIEHIMSMIDGADGKAGKMERMMRGGANTMYHAAGEVSTYLGEAEDAHHAGKSAYARLLGYQHSVGSFSHDARAYYAGAHLASNHIRDEMGNAKHEVHLASDAQNRGTSAQHEALQDDELMSKIGNDAHRELADAERYYNSALSAEDQAHTYYTRMENFHRRSHQEEGLVRHALSEGLEAQQGGQHAIQEAVAVNAETHEAMSEAHASADEAKLSTKDAEEALGDSRRIQTSAAQGLRMAHHAMENMHDGDEEVQHAVEVSEKAMEHAEGQMSDAEATQRASKTAADHAMLATQKSQRSLVQADAAADKAKHATNQASQAVDEANAEVEKAYQSSTMAKKATSEAKSMLGQAEADKELADQAHAEAEQALATAGVSAQHAKSAVASAQQHLNAGAAERDEAKAAASEAAATIGQGKAAAADAAEAMEGTKLAAEESASTRKEAVEALEESKQSVGEAKASFQEAEGAMAAAGDSVRVANEALADIKSVSSAVSDLANQDMTNVAVEDKVTHLLQFLSAQDTVNSKTQIGLASTVQGLDAAVAGLDVTKTTQSHILDSMLKHGATDEKIMSTIAKNTALQKKMMDSVKANADIANFTVKSTEKVQNVVTSSISSMKKAEELQDAIMSAQEAVQTSMEDTTESLRKTQDTNKAALKAVDSNGKTLAKTVEAINGNVDTVGTVAKSLELSQTAAQKTLAAITANGKTMEAAADVLHKQHESDKAIMESIYAVGQTDLKQNGAMDSYTSMQEAGLKRLGSTQTNYDKMIAGVEATQQSQSQLLGVVTAHQQAMEEQSKVIDNAGMASAHTLHQAEQTQAAQGNVLTAIAENTNSLKATMGAVEVNAGHDEKSLRDLSSSSHYGGESLASVKAKMSQFGTQIDSDTEHAHEEYKKLANDDDHFKTSTGSFNAARARMQRMAVASHNDESQLAKLFRDQEDIKLIQNKHHQELANLTLSTHESVEYTQEGAAIAHENGDTLKKMEGRVDKAVAADKLTKQLLAHQRANEMYYASRIKHQGQQIRHFSHMEDRQADALRHAERAEKQFGTVLKTAEGEYQAESNKLQTINGEEKESPAGKMSAQFKDLKGGLGDIMGMLGQAKADHITAEHNMEHFQQEEYNDATKERNLEVGSANHGHEAEVTEKALNGQEEALMQSEKLVGHADHDLKNEVDHLDKEFEPLDYEMQQDDDNVHHMQEEMQTEWSAGKKLNHAIDDYTSVSKGSYDHLHELETSEGVEAHKQDYMRDELKKVQVLKDKFTNRLHLVEDTKGKALSQQKSLDGAMAKVVHVSMQKLSETAGMHPTAEGSKETEQVQNLQTKQVSQGQAINGAEHKLENNQGASKNLDNSSNQTAVNAEKLAEFTDYLDEQDRKMQDTSKVLASTLYGMSGAFVVVFCVFGALHATWNGQIGKIQNMKAEK